MFYAPSIFLVMILLSGLNMMFLLWQQNFGKPNGGEKNATFSISCQITVIPTANQNQTPRNWSLDFQWN